MDLIMNPSATLRHAQLYHGDAMGMEMGMGMRMRIEMEIGKGDGA